MSKTEKSIQVVDNYQLLTKAEIDVQISTAKTFPRDLQRCIQNTEFLATSSQEIAENCIYILPRGGKSIEGPSVRLAEIVASQFGNLNSGARIIGNDGKTITAQGICHDLETNNRITVEVRRKITDKNGRTYSEDMQVIAGNAAMAIAFRNAIFKVIPAAFTNPIFEKCKQIAKGTDASLSKRRDAAFSWFHTKEITAEMIFEHFDVRNKEEINIEMLSMLSGYKSAVVNDSADIKEIFSVSKKQKVAEKKETVKKSQSKKGGATKMP
jgi:hypothetical protein